MSWQESDVRLEERGVTLHMRRRARTTGKGVPMVFLHGWPASSAGWVPVVDRMPEDRDYILADLRGLGGSERIGNVAAYEKQSIAEDMLALLNHLEIDRFVVAGQDWGGVAAQEIALAVPDRVTGLVIMNIHLINNAAGNLKGQSRQMMSPENPCWYMTFQSVPGFAEAMIPGHEEKWIEYFFSHVADGNHINPKNLDAYVDAYRTPGTPEAGANYYRSMSSDYERWATLDGEVYSMPSLLLYGRHDRFLTPEFYDGYETCFKHVTKVDVEAGHFVQDERPADVAEAIAHFLSRLE